MELDFLRFFDACDPSKTLAIANPEDRQYYIDFASVRGGKIIEALERTISLRSRLNQPTCQLFTGHIGCGKSTELRRGKKGLVVIVDNLDRVEDRRNDSGRTQPEYLFVDRGEQLRRLNCHLVYTIPLTLMFSNDYQALTNRFGGGVAPRVLPMVSCSAFKP